MTERKIDMQARAQSIETTLGVLDFASEGETTTQRTLAERLGVALGLTNAVLKRCVKKGLLKVQQAPARRYAYYLTPKGFAEKSKLTAEYLGYSLTFYRRAREEYAEIFQYCEARNWNKIALISATELSEIASLAAIGTETKIVGILDPGRNLKSFCDLDVIQSFEELSPDSRPNAVIITDTQAPQAVYDQLIDILPADRILAPKMLHIVENGCAAPAESIP